MALTAAERQKKHRDKLRKLINESNEDQRKYVADALKKLIKDGKIPDDIVNEIKENAFIMALKDLERIDKITTENAKNKIDEFFKL